MMPLYMSHEGNGLRIWIKDDFDISVLNLLKQL